jgi:hypothetical protein
LGGGAVGEAGGSARWMTNHQTYQVEIIGAVSGSAWDHPPWGSDDHDVFFGYCLSLIEGMERDLGAALPLRISGLLACPTIADGGLVRSLVSLIGSEQDVARVQRRDREKSG